MPLWFYHAYGITVGSELPLPELAPAPESQADALIRRGTGEHAAAIPTPFGATFAAGGQEATLWWQQLGAFVVRGGAEIIVDAHPGTADELVRLPLLGVVLAVLLHQRGSFALHGSAVAIGGACVACVGAKGQGKSTLLAALHRRGHTLLSDDIVVVDHNGPCGPTVRPGSAQIKLWPDTLSGILDADPATIPPLVAGYEKRGHMVGERFAQSPLPLARIYVLGTAPAVRLRPLSRQETFAELAGHTYLARFGGDPFAGTVAAAHLRWCSQLLNAVPVARLERPRDLSRLAEAAALIEADVAAHASGDVMPAGAAATR